MGAEYERCWPKCGCSERCAKRKCIQAGGQRLSRSVSLESLGISDVGKKNSPERMTLVLNKLAEWPNVTKATAFGGIVHSTLRYWLKKSMTGQPGDGFDLQYGEENKRFHEHYADVIDGGVQRVEDAYLTRALEGYQETLHHQGRVAYKYDDDLLRLGLTGSDAYLLDDNGKPIPESVHHQDPEVMESVLRAHRRDRWGQRDQLDVTHRGGVMVVTAPAKSSAELEQRERASLGAPVDVEFVEVVSENDDGAES